MTIMSKGIYFLTIMFYLLYLTANDFKGYEDESKQLRKCRERTPEAESVFMKAIAQVPIGAGFLNIAFNIY